MQSDVNFPLVLCKPTSQIIQPKFNQCKRFVLRPHFSVIYLTLSILGSSPIFGLSLKYTLRFVPSITGTEIVDGNIKNVTLVDENKSFTFTPDAEGYYAIQYLTTAATEGTQAAYAYKVVYVAAATK